VNHRQHGHPVHHADTDFTAFAIVDTIIESRQDQSVENPRREFKAYTVLGNIRVVLTFIPFKFIASVLTSCMYRTVDVITPRLQRGLAGGAPGGL
jgi:hypothetical protein